MNLIRKWTDLSTLWKILTIAIPAAVIAGVVILIVVMNSGLTATTMRLLKVQGTVALQDADGNERTLVENMRFNSGDAISTGVSSLASIALDDHKIVTLDESSRAVFTKEHNMMELNLTAGGVFFDVNQPLEENETFDIRTATMTVGIRGTSGYVSVDSEGIATLVLTSGHVTVTGKNPTTGETKTVNIGPGQRVRVFLYNDRTIGSVDFALTDITEEDLNQFILDRLGENQALRITVCNTNGWDEDLILELGGYSVTVEETEETDETTTTSSSETSASDSSGEPTNTPTSTATPVPADNNDYIAATATPTPSEAPAATATATPIPTATATPTPSPTNAPSNGGNGGSSDPTPTPAPTATPVPTATNAPTATPAPTATAVPTAAPTATTAPTNTPEPTTDPSQVITDTPVPTITDSPEPTPIEDPEGDDGTD